MDELYRIHSSFSSCTADADGGGTGTGTGTGKGKGTSTAAADHGSSSQVENLVPAGFRFIDENEVMMMGSEMSDFLKAQIANHPLYPNLISAYIECRKVGAPPEIASLLEEISKENHHQHPIASPPPPPPPPTEIGADPELDQFMECYCEALNKYKEELLKPFHEATSFLNDIETQLLNLCKDNLITATTTSSFTSVNYQSDEAGVTSHDDEDLSCGEVEVGESQESSGRGGGGGEVVVVHQAAETELKEMLMRKYSGYLSSLRKEFLKKRKKGKLPKNARMTLLEWWTTHYRWPYPTEEEKNKLSEVTGLDQRQINNWFINQRKRHWKPSEDMRFALMQGVTATVTPPPSPMYFDTAGGPAGFDT